MKKVKVGVIGLGEVAQIIHLPILDSLADRFEIAALCDISEQLLQLMGEKYRVTRLYNNPIDLCEQPDLDAVFVLNSDEYHAECAIAAMNNKKHVLIEKPMCLTQREADEIIKARDANGVQIMVGYMRRFAPAFLQGVEEVKKLSKINYAKIRDIIGQNRLIIEQSSIVHRFNDISAEAIQDKTDRAKKMVLEAIGEAPQEISGAYRLLCGLNSHDISAMREIIGMPKRVVSAAQWKGGGYINAILEFDGFFATFETGVDNQRRFDASIEVFGDTKSLTVQYDTPYIRHLPTTLIVKETVGDTYNETVIRPTFKDPYTCEIEEFYEVVTNGAQPKTTPEDYKQDLIVFKMIIDALKEAVQKETVSI
ncbi:Gfo/Idh/MocA family protein [Neobacillus cucumis]|uniref:Gfo/Idh/MocA family oxidoreductase n=1 Tax=Neobacillus cucumis TaxID=1740721 RepID=A0A2N5HVW2_9BACI|nr:Gfo/Idh/MocA family oxidoreductase [Neobacillus cucumis]PLS09658.1 gfo/Idh/MocA family oxidoreductase [Neobacillus cucumis]